MFLMRKETYRRANAGEISALSQKSVRDQKQIARPQSVYKGLGYRVEDWLQKQYFLASPEGAECGKEY